MDKVIRKYKIMYNTDKRWLVMTTVAVSLVWGILDSQPVSADVMPDAGQEKVMADSVQGAILNQQKTQTLTVTEKEPATDEADKQAAKDGESFMQKPVANPETPSNSVTIRNSNSADSAGTGKTGPVNEDRVNEEPTAVAPVEKSDELVTSSDDSNSVVVKKEPETQKSNPRLRSIASTPTPAVTVVQPVAETEESIDEWMPDQNLQKLLLYKFSSQYGISSASQITKKMVSEMVGFTMSLERQQESLEYFNAVIGVKSLKGLEYATNLEELTIYPDFSAIKYWHGSFIYGSISDISALAGLTNLKELNLQESQIEDISPLKNLHLTQVSLSYNKIYDISALENSMTSLASPAMTVSTQVIKFPPVILNSNTLTYTLPSFVVKNMKGQNVPITPEVRSENFGRASDGVGSNIDDQTVTWKLNTTQGYLFMKWWDPLMGMSGYPYAGEIIVPYMLNDTVGNVNVNFKTTSGLALAPQVTLSGTLGGSFDLKQSPEVRDSVQQIMQKGYSCVGTENSVPVTGVYAKDASNITLLFDVKDINTTFKFLDESGHNIGETQTKKGKYGQNWQVTVPDLTGYSFQKANQNGRNLTVTDSKLSGVLSSDSTITLVYETNKEKATIQYVYADGKQAAPNQTVAGKYGESISFPVSPEIDGYVASKLAPATYGDGDAVNTFRVTYIKDAVTVTPPVITPEQKITVTVHYQTAGGTMVAPDVTVTGKPGDGYTTSPAAKVADGYQLSVTPANASGTLGNKDFAVTYIYEKTGGTGDKITPDTDRPTTQLNKPAITPSGDKQIPAKKPQTGDQTDTLTDSHGNQAVTTAVFKIGKQTDQPAISKALTGSLPQTNDDEQNSQPWGVALLVMVLGLLGLKLKHKEQ